MTYDPERRRQTPLADRLIEIIKANGPIGVDAYMEACLGDPEHGYYRTQAAIGAEGDFITAPEISQIFGELIGLWAAVVWQGMGEPGSIRLVELGPGRGTLMADALRAVRVLPGFLEAAEVLLVEPNPVLRQRQQTTLEAQRDAGVRLAWHETLVDIEGGPTILIANEVLDVLPARQWIATQTGWQSRRIGLDDAGQLTFLGADPSLPTSLSPGGPAPDSWAAGDLFETRDLGTFLGGLERVAGNGPFAGLFFDYGHQGPLVGDTLQAISKQHHEHPLTSPGEADLTALVDFNALARDARARGFAVDGAVTQGDFLGGLGIAQRASRLMAANPAKAGEIETGVARLMAPQGMGTRFKAIGLRRGLAAPLPALDASPGPNHQTL
ncbi:MAG: class I SAM-dependent methyltransferase [Hyphomicrobiaceae bacterium]